MAYSFGQLVNAVLISGWGVAPETMRPATVLLPPGTQCRFLAPVDGCAGEAAGCDYVIAWSYGAWQVLSAAAGGMNFRGRVLLLAPFVSFCSEFGLGGRCSKAQVLWLHRWLKRDPTAALTDFHMRAELGPAPTGLPYDREDLLKGLEDMAEEASPALGAFAAKGLTAGWRAAVGARDRLLEGEAICRALPGCRLVANAGHSVESLVSAVKGGNGAL